MDLKDKFDSLLQTAKKVIADKTLFTSRDEAANRLAACGECDNLKFCYGSTGKPYCNICKCGLYAKINIHGSSCPDGKW